MVTELVALANNIGVELLENVTHSYISHESWEVTVSQPAFYDETDTHANVFIWMQTDDPM